MRTIICIDPGNTESAYVYTDTIFSFIKHRKLPNEELLKIIYENEKPDIVAIEMIASYGMPVGKEVFETCLWIGRFIEALGSEKVKLVYRKDIKIHLCGSMKAKDANIRLALIDRFGNPGTKKNPGFTYGISKDMWSALAVASYSIDKYHSNQ